MTEDTRFERAAIIRRDPELLEAPRFDHCKAQHDSISRNLADNLLGKSIPAELVGKHFFLAMSR